MQAVSFGPQWDTIRTTNVGEEIWFVLKDVCGELGIIDVRQVAERLDKAGIRQADVTDSLGRLQSTTVINRSNLISFLSRSTKPEAFALLDQLYRWMFAASPDVAQLQVQLAQLARQNAELVKQNEETLQALVQGLQRQVDVVTDIVNPGGKLLREADLEDWKRLYIRMTGMLRDLRSAKKITPAQHQELKDLLQAGERVFLSHLNHWETYETVGEEIWRNAYFTQQKIDTQQQELQKAVTAMQELVGQLPAASDRLQLAVPEQ